MESDPTIRDFADRALRQSLENRDNLQSFLKQAIPQFADGFDCARAKLVPREFSLDDWRSRESDLLFEIPYRDKDSELVALVCVLIEHQTKSDPRMALRTLTYAVLYWDREWKSWEQLKPPRPEFKLTPVIPIVLHTSTSPWSSPRSLVNLLGGPESLHAFAPRWEPLFWELASHTSAELLDSKDAFMQLLAVIRAEEDDPASFEAVYTEFIREVEGLYGSNRVRWYDLLRVVVTWASWRRPKTERKHWQGVAQRLQSEQAQKREVDAMVQTIGEAIWEEARVAQAQQTLLLQGTDLIGVPNEETEAKIKAILDLELLNKLLVRILRSKSWEELLEPK